MLLKVCPHSNNAKNTYGNLKYQHMKHMGAQFACCGKLHVVVMCVFLFIFDI